MTTETMFENAIRNKFRFPTCRGDVSLEQLFDIPLRSRDEFNLNTIAKMINRKLVAETEENFVETAKQTPEKKKQQALLDLVKYVIDVKLTEEQDAKDNAERKEEKAQLLSILAAKEQDALKSLSVSELKKRINALG